MSAKSSAEGLLGVVRSSSLGGLMLPMSGSAIAELLDSVVWDAVSAPYKDKG